MKNYKELFDSLPPDDQKLLQGYTDSRVTLAIKKYSENVAILPNAATRLAVIESKANSEIARLEINNLVLKKCYERKIDFDTVNKLGINFTDEKSIDEKLDLLSKDIKLNETNDLNKLIATAFRPGSGANRDNQYLNITSEQYNQMSFAERQEFDRLNRNK